MKNLILSFLFISLFTSHPLWGMEQSAVEDLEREYAWYQRAPETYTATKHVVRNKIECGGCVCYACIMCYACCKVSAPHVAKAVVMVVVSKRME